MHSNASMSSRICDVSAIFLNNANLEEETLTISKLQ